MTTEATAITQKYVEALNKKFEGKQTISGDVIKFDVMVGSDYDKITLPKWNGLAHGSAHAFVERETGKLFKAASWKYPVADARYDLSIKEEFELAIEFADPFGNYLRRKSTYGKVYWPDSVYLREK
jgi:hypothetical protein